MHTQPLHEGYSNTLIWVDTVTTYAEHVYTLGVVLCEHYGGCSYHLTLLATLSPDDIHSLCTMHILLSVCYSLQHSTYNTPNGCIWSTYTVPTVYRDI